MTGRIRIAFAGAGRRMREVYFPVVRSLVSRLEPVGITTRRQESGEEASRELGLAWYPGIEALIEGAKPDLVALCVPPAANAGLAREVIRRGKAVLMETPVSLSLRQARKLRGEARQALVGVAEQKPFMPLEQFKQKLIAAGALGRVRVAHNDFRSYDYHAIAQLRSYVGRQVACSQVRCSTRRFPLRPYRKQDAEAASGKAKVEKWDLAMVSMEDGSMLLHHFTDQYKSAPFRTWQSLRIYGDSGSMVNDAIAMLDIDGLTHHVQVRIESGSRPGQAVRRISAVLPDGGEIAWENPFGDADLADDQIGLACHFEAMACALQGEGKPLYSLDDAVVDLEVMAAARLSALKGGAPVALPLNPLREAMGLCLSPSAWGKGLELVRRMAGR